MNSLSIALNYIERGWSPVPIPFGEKGPTMDKWNEVIITRDNASKFFNNSRQNIGVPLSPKSGGLCDIDLDCPEAVNASPAFDSGGLWQKE